MSELKARTARSIADAEEILELGADCQIEQAQVYLKSEADEVIAEKDKEIQRLENLCESYRIDCDNLAIREANAYKEIERDNKQIRRNKYKRCLTMAKRCFTKSNYHFVLARHGEDAKENNRRSILYYKWRKRWLKIAKKFKEAK